MDLTDSTDILQQILVSELDQKSTRNRCWARKLAQVSKLDEARSLELAKALVSALAFKTMALRIPKGAVALYTEAQLHKLGVEKFEVPGYFSYYAMKEAPDRLLFRKKVAQKGQPFENAAEIIDLKTQWLEILPFQIRHLEFFKKGGTKSSHLVIRAAEWLERLRLATEKDILRIGNPDEFKKASKKERAKLDYCSIASFDRILIIDLLRKNFLKLTPKAEYHFHRKDGHVKRCTPKALHNLIYTVSEQNRYRLHPSAKTILRRFEKQSKNLN